LPSFRAVDAAIGAEKKNQTCAPLPDRERSTTAGSPSRREVSTKAAELSGGPSGAKRIQHPTVEPG
jgi:hypothetical protein